MTPLFIIVTTRSLADPDRVERKLINYARPQSREWLASHQSYAMRAGYSVTIAPDIGD